MKETFNINVERENINITKEKDDDDGDGLHTNQKDTSKKMVGQKHTHHF